MPAPKNLKGVQHYNTLTQIWSLAVRVSNSAKLSHGLVALLHVLEGTEAVLVRERNPKYSKTLTSGNYLSQNSK